MIEKEKILESLEKLRKEAKKRRFIQSVDLIITLKNLDPKKFRFSEEVYLPYGSGKKKKIVVFSDVFKTSKAKVITSAELKELEGKRKESRKLAKSFDFSLAEPKLMKLIGKILGPFLGPRGKMPKIVVDERQLEALIPRLEKSVRLRSKGSLCLQCSVGNEKMKDEEIAENIISVLNFVVSKLPEGKNNIKKIFVKFTMSSPVEVKFK